MKIVQCVYETLQRLALLDDINRVVKLLPISDVPSRVVDLLSSTSKNRVSDLLIKAEKNSETVSLDSVKLLAPVTQPDKVLCIGMNYADHCAEQNKPIPKEPVVFNKFPSCITGPYDKIIHPASSSQVDWEAELAMIIGKKCYQVTEAEASDYIFGFTVAHDVTARDWQKQRNGGQWLLGKAMDTFCPLGPCIVTADSGIDPHKLEIGCRVNGNVQQRSSTSQMVFSCEKLLAHISQCITLLPGDVILTGTPPGVGVFRQPPVFLQRGDTVECWVEGIGTISNKVE